MTEEDGLTKENLLNFMNCCGFDSICDLRVHNGREEVASKFIDCDKLWWRNIEVEGSGFNKLFKGSLFEVEMRNE